MQFTSSYIDDFGYDIIEYDIYCNKEIGERFKSYPVLVDWEPITKMSFSVYGLSFEEIVKIVNELDTNQ